jgi:multicomponent K+:H+ antiporter subunit E
MIRRLVPRPFAAAALLATWLILNQSLSPGAFLLGAVLALLLSGLMSRLDLPPGRWRSIGASFRLLGVVLAEIVRSNNAVGWIILQPGERGRKSGFVHIPLEMRSPYGLTFLALIITATPGTVWVEYNSADNTVLLHVLDLIDEAAWVKIVKERYERPLMEIFE